MIEITVVVDAGKEHAPYLKGLIEGSLKGYAYSRAYLTQTDKFFEEIEKDAWDRGELEI